MAGHGSGSPSESSSTYDSAANSLGRERIGSRTITSVGESAFASLNRFAEISSENAARVDQGSDPRKSVATVSEGGKAVTYATNNVVTEQASSCIMPSQPSPPLIPNIPDFLSTV